MKSGLTPLKDIFERITDAIVALDTDWRYTFVNKKAAGIFNRKPEDLIGKHIWTEFPEGIDQPFYKAYYKAAETQQFIYIEEYYPPYDRWFENRIYPSEEGLTIFFTDITERNKTEKTLQEKEHVLRLLVEYSPAALALFDRDMKYIVARRRYLADYTWANKTWSGAPIMRCFPRCRSDGKRSIAAAWQAQ